MIKHPANFVETKNKFDSEYKNLDSYTANIPVHLTVGKTYKIKGVKNEPNEEFFKWQFIHSIINSGLYPKGNKNSAPIKFDAAVFDDSTWFEYYTEWHTKKTQESLDWLRKHLLGVIEFKKENSKDIEGVYNQQLKPALKESENDFCMGVIYDTERLYLFQKKGANVLRLDEGYNTKEEKSSTKDLSLHLTDAYYKIPSLEELQKRIYSIELDRSKRTIDDLDLVTGFYSKQLTDGIYS